MADLVPVGAVKLVLEEQSAVADEGSVFEELGCGRRGTECDSNSAVNSAVQPSSSTN